MTEVNITPKTAKMICWLMDAIHSMPISIRDLVPVDSCIDPDWARFNKVMDEIEKIAND